MTDDLARQAYAVADALLKVRGSVSSAAPSMADILDEPLDPPV